MKQVIVILFVVFLPFLLSAEDKEQRAKLLFKEAAILFGKEQYKDASKKFKACYDLRPAYKILYNIGQSEAASKRYGISLQSFEKYLAQGGDDIPQSRQEEVRNEIKRLRDLIGFLEIKAKNGSVIYVDNVKRGIYPTVKRVPVAATVVHQVSAKNKDGMVTPSQEISVTGGDSVSISFIFAENEAVDDGKSVSKVENLESNEALIPELNLKTKAFFISGVVVGGVGVAALVGGSIFGGLSLVKDDLVRKRCPTGTCSSQYRDLVNTRQRYVLMSTILWASGGVLTAAGLTMVLIPKLNKNGDTEGRVAIMPIVGGLSVNGEF